MLEKTLLFRIFDNVSSKCLGLVVWQHWTEKYSLNLRRRLRKKAEKKTKKQQIT